MSPDHKTKTTVAIEAGLRLLDRYVLVAQLAEGGMGSVWLATHHELGSKVAIKFTHEGDERTETRFFHEARTAAALESPHIVQVFDVGRHQGIPFLVMEYLEGVTMADHLHANGKLAHPETLSIFTQLERGLAVAHGANVVHRDLKPSNIFLLNNGSERLCKILDFGIARTTDSTHTHTGDFLGPPRYSSPEQVTDSARVDSRTDLWALALIAYECVVGESAFKGKTALQIVRQLGSAPMPRPSQRADVPPGFDAWFAKATETPPEARFQTVGELVASLRDALVGGQPNTTPTNNPTKPLPVFNERTTVAPTVVVPRSKSQTFSPSTVGSVGGALALVAATGLWFLFRANEDVPPDATARSAFELSSPQNEEPLETPPPTPPEKQSASQPDESSPDLTPSPPPKAKPEKPIAPTRRPQPSPQSVRTSPTQQRGQSAPPRSPSPTKEALKQPDDIQDSWNFRK